MPTIVYYYIRLNILLINKIIHIALNKANNKVSEKINDFIENNGIESIQKNEEYFENNPRNENIQNKKQNSTLYIDENKYTSNGIENLNSNNDKNIMDDSKYQNKLGHSVDINLTRNLKRNNFVEMNLNSLDQYFPDIKDASDLTQIKDRRNIHQFHKNGFPTVFQNKNEYKNSNYPLIHKNNNFNVNYKNFKRVDLCNIMENFLNSNELKSLIKTQIEGAKENEERKSKNNINRYSNKKFHHNKHHRRMSILHNRNLLIEKMKNISSTENQQKLLHIENQNCLLKDKSNAINSNYYKYLQTNNRKQNNEEENLYKALNIQIDENNFNSKVMSFSMETNFVNCNNSSNPLLKNMIDLNESPLNSYNNLNINVENNNNNLNNFGFNNNNISQKNFISMFKNSFEPIIKVNENYIVNNKQNENFQEESKKEQNVYNENYNLFKIRKISRDNLKEAEILNKIDQLIVNNNKNESINCDEDKIDNLKIKYHSFEEENLINTNSCFIANNMLDKLINLKDPDIFLNIIEKIVVNNIVYSIFSEERFIPTNLNLKNNKKSFDILKDNDNNNNIFGNVNEILYSSNNIYDNDKDLNLDTSNGKSSYLVSNKNKSGSLIEDRKYFNIYNKIKDNHHINQVNNSQKNHINSEEFNAYEYRIRKSNIKEKSKNFQNNKGTADEAYNQNYMVFENTDNFENDNTNNQNNYTSMSLKNMPKQPVNYNSKYNLNIQNFNFDFNSK